MKVSYLVEIMNPETHLLRVRINLSDLPSSKDITVFLPVWSPGSYMVRDYSRHLRWMTVTNKSGKRLVIENLSKSQWKILKSDNESSIDVEYEIYAHELTVRTAHIDSTHAFLQGPCYLMGVQDIEIKNPEIEFRFTQAWSKLSTALTPIEGKRSEFKYTAKDYDELIDSPVEIGCHETDGFLVQGKEHALAFYGEMYPHPNNLKQDFKTVVEYITQFMGGIPYERYLFITHFFPKAYGGLEHLNSTALHFDGRKLLHRKDYLNFIALVSHEYFHLWNVKRIRPIELGPFNYHQENYTSMLWLAEGLTSLMDNLFVYNAGLCKIEEYLEWVKADFEAYYATPGKKFHSLEESSYNAWIKLYKPDENSRNSSISYYLKGGLVFLVLHLKLLKFNKSIKDFILALWDHYGKNPKRGITKKEIYSIVEGLSNSEVMNSFSTMVETTFDIDFESELKAVGLEFSWLESVQASLGVDWEFQGQQAIIRTVTLDSPGFKAGLNAQDEIIAVNGMRFFKEDAEKLGTYFKIDQPYQFTVARLGKLLNIEVIPGKAPRVLREISIRDKAVAEKAFTL